MKKTKTIYICDFCGKDNDQVDKMIQGPQDISICNECVDLCIEIVYSGLPPVDQRRES